MEHFIVDAGVAAATRRRRFLVNAGRLAAFTGVAAIGGCGSEESPLANTPTPTPSGTPTSTPTAPTIVPVTDTDMMVLMLQLHYVQAEFYSRAVLGVPLAASLLTGAGTAGDVTGPRQVTFTDTVLGEYMREIAVEKIDQVVRLRAALGTAAVARPTINLAVDETGVFTKYGRDSNDVPAATGSAARGTYDVYANQDRFLLGAFILEDTTVIGWRGIATLMTGSANIDVATGLLATSAFHTGLVRSQLFIRGGNTGSTLRQSTIRLSDLRDTYGPVEDDRGVAGGLTGNAATVPDINPADGEGEIYGRLPNLTVNTVYMTRAADTSGGFFPAGLNGALRQASIT